MPTRQPLLSLAAVAAITACTAQTPPPVSSAPAETNEPAPAASDSSAFAEGPVASPSPIGDPAAVLEVEDQTSEGPTVLARAAISRGGFVVVFSADGRNTLGTGTVPAGAQLQDVQVSLAEELTEQVTLIARLYADTDGNGFYSAADQPVGGADGEQVEFGFMGKPVQLS